MHAIKSHPETQSRSWTASSSHADVALVAAILAPLAILGFLVLIGVGVGVAVCIMFASVFAVTTTLDVRCLLRCRRARNDLRRTRE